MTDEDIVRAIMKLTGGHRGRQQTFEVQTEWDCQAVMVYSPEGWTDRAGKWHEQVPDYLHSLDALVPVIRLLSLDSQVALCSRVALLMPPRFICLEILRVVGHFDP